MDMAFYATTGESRFNAADFGGSRGDLRAGNATSTPAGTAYLTAMLMDKLGPYPQTRDNEFPIIYHPDGDPGKPLVYGTQNTYRSPTLWRYNRDHMVRNIQGVSMPRPVINTFMYYSQEWETFSNYSSALGTGTNPVGEASDGIYFNSGAQSDFQKALARANLAVFFGADPVTFDARDRSLLYKGPDAETETIRESEVNIFDAGG